MIETMAVPARPSCCFVRLRPGKAHTLNFLTGYQGRFRQCDACQSCHVMTEIARHNGFWHLVCCWTHVRRRFAKRFGSDGAPIAEEMLRQAPPRRPRQCRC